jgi:hypothetical protein
MAGRGRGWRLFAALAGGLCGAPAAAQQTATPLFASDDLIRLTLRGPIEDVSRNRSRAPRPASLVLAGAAPETHAVRLSPRGITRLKRDTCQFAPMRIDFAGRRPDGSLFEGQNRLKLVTHCRATASFQQHVLLEYATYRLYNVLTPASYRVRLAMIDYVEENGEPVTTRLGFFIEDIDDAARRNGMAEAAVGDRIGISQLSPRDAARASLFQYMIGNLDWDIVAGPAGEGCCHNSRLIAPAAGMTRNLVPMPYDFDYSGLVDTPYAVPPEQIPVNSVKRRYYRGFCRHNAEAGAVAGEFRARRAAMEAVFGQVPQLDQRTRAAALRYLSRFFDEIADPAKLQRLLRTCRD